MNFLLDTISVGFLHFLFEKKRPQSCNMKYFGKQKINWKLCMNKSKMCLQKKFRAIKIHTFNDQADYFSNIRY